MRSSRSTFLLGALTGFCSALVPSGFAVYPGGAGAFGGVAAACIGCAALALPVMYFLVPNTVGREDDEGISVGYFLSAVKPSWYRGGSCGAALAQWVLFAASAAVAGAVTGLGDGLRAGHPLGSFRGMCLAIAVLILVSAYTTIIASGVSVNAHGKLRGLVANYGSLALFVGLLAFGVDNPVAQTARVLPAAPLWGLLPPEVTGRFTLSVSWVESVAVAGIWVAAGIAGFLRCIARGGLPFRD
ncbi:hypothetical protein Ari01nite_84650 [Paractinoplanes rishiriensis]|uniref:Uncharacterized protein n=2 Tax=Paractinoplanes rishiriensis TaxID=1050105 RepID=A0A919N1B2_9ACTN|nr:hypothetical protein Ari01nite_84650 [Actinoplanes rishiriensis]